MLSFLPLVALAPLAQVRVQSVEPSEVVDRSDPARLVVVEGVSVERLQRLDFDVVYVDPENGGVQIVAHDAHLEQLRAAGIPFRTERADLVAYYQSRFEVAPPEGGLGAWLSPPFGAGSMGGYYTFSEIVSVLDQMKAAYPNLITAKSSLGQSIEGRELWMVKISDNPDVDEAEPETRFDSMHHCREPESMQATLWFMLFLLENYGTDPMATYLVNQREAYFIPVVNPDGYVYNETTNPGGGGMWRKNRRNNGDGTFGVDLNRNYPFQWGFDNVGSSPSTSSNTYRGPAPQSEPEVQAMVNFISGRNFRTALSSHTFSNLWIHAWGYDAILPAPPADTQFDELSALATAENGYLAGPAAATLYAANGVTLDYDFGVHGTFGWTPEIGGDNDGFWPPTNRIIPLAEENLLAFQRTALFAGAFVHPSSIQVVEIGDNDGFFEPGESASISVVVRNSGVNGSGTPVVGSVGSSSPFANMITSNYDFGVVGSFASSNNNFAPFVIDIDAAAPAGTTIDYTLGLTYEGFAQDFDGTIFVGEPIALIEDELDADLGWTAGLPGDTATTGLWVRADPIGTTSSGSQVSPEDDNTPGAGGECFVTGNGGGSGGTDDVDNGLTTLITPALDLSGVGAARISYARWFADFSTVDDTFQVAISDDGGSNWTSLENVTGNQNQWNTVSFEVADFVNQTNDVRLRFIAEDNPNNSLVEAAIDSLKVEIFDSEPRLNVYGAPQVGGSVVFNITGDPGATWILFHTGPASAAPVSHQGLIQQAAHQPLQAGVVPVAKVAHVQGNLPNDANLSGQTIHYRAAVISGGTVSFTNTVSLAVQ